MAKLPNGATMMVLMICAPLIRVDCKAMGLEIFSALRRYPHTHEKGILSCRNRNILLRTMAKYACVHPAVNMASAVPIAAPGTPKPNTKIKR